MARKFSELEAKMTPERIAAGKERARVMLEELPLNRLRVARELTQEHLGRLLGKDQSAVSQIERRTDMYISTLADFIKAMGGDLELRANFPDGSVRVKIADSRE
jgi:hypothetical protein